MLSDGRENSNWQQRVCAPQPLPQSQLSTAPCASSLVHFTAHENAGVCSMTAIGLPGASARVGTNKGGKLQRSPSPTALARRAPAAEMTQLSLCPRFWQWLLNHSKANLTTRPFLNPNCPFQILILNIIPSSIHLPRQCLFQLQSQLYDTTRDIILLKVVEQMQIKSNSEKLKAPNRRDCLGVTPGKHHKTSQTLHRLPGLVISADANTLFSHRIFCLTRLKHTYLNTNPILIKKYVQSKANLKKQKKEN